MSSLSDSYSQHIISFHQPTPSWPFYLSFWSEWILLHTGLLSWALDRSLSVSTEIQCWILVTLLLQSVTLSPSSEKVLFVCSFFLDFFFFRLCFVFFPPTFIGRIIWLELTKSLWDTAKSKLNLGAGALISSVIEQRLGNQFPGEGDKFGNETCSYPVLNFVGFLR